LWNSTNPEFPPLLLLSPLDHHHTITQHSPLTRPAHTRQLPQRRLPLLLHPPPQRLHLHLLEHLPPPSPNPRIHLALAPTIPSLLVQHALFLLCRLQDRVG